MEGLDRRLLAVAVISGTAVALSILTSNIVGQAMSAWLWTLLVPVGMFIAGPVFVISAAILLARRLGASTRAP